MEAPRSRSRDTKQAKSLPNKIAHPTQGDSAQQITPVNAAGPKKRELANVSFRDEEDDEVESKNTPSRR